MEILQLRGENFATSRQTSKMSILGGGCGSVRSVNWGVFFRHGLHELTRFLVYMYIKFFRAIRVIRA